MFISTIPNLSVNQSLIELIKKRNKDATVILTSDYIDGALELYNSGADYVILPHFLGGDYISKLITKYKKDLKDLLSEKVLHINELKERKEFGFDHVRKSK